VLVARAAEEFAARTALESAAGRYGHAKQLSGELADTAAAAAAAAREKGADAKEPASARVKRGKKGKRGRLFA